MLTVTVLNFYAVLKAVPTRPCTVLQAMHGVSHRPLMPMKLALCYLLVVVSPAELILVPCCRHQFLSYLDHCGRRSLQVQEFSRREARQSAV